MLACARERFYRFYPVFSGRIGEDLLASKLLKRNILCRFCHHLFPGNTGIAHKLDCLKVTLLKTS
jgi:hypothetical protein